MKKTLLLLQLALLWSVSLWAQAHYVVVNQFPQSHYPMLTIGFDQLEKSADGRYHFTMETPKLYSAFAIGWKEPLQSALMDQIVVEYRCAKAENRWNDFKTAGLDIMPDESITGLCWTDLLFGIDEYTHRYVEVYVSVPEGMSLDMIYLHTMDMSIDADPNWKPSYTTASTRDCPAFPAYIARADWCGGYTACHNPTYTVQNINPTHTVIHHGASPDNYTDGAAVVRGYWNYHVNSNGWNDIGYNYLSDKYGNLYQGRHNLNLPTTDVLGAHAGASNTKSIGINFMGNADVTQPTVVQLEKVEQFLAWWYNYRGFDPTTSANIVLQSGGTASKYRICGHRDVNVGGTTCPGNVLYAQLSAIRTATKDIIDACSTPPDGIAPTSQIEIEGNLVDQWRASDCYTEFADYDNSGGSGLDASFYQVLEYDGTQWRGNPSNGFFNDNFENSIHAAWTDAGGTWSINNSHLQQSAEDLSNTNLYAQVTQDNAHSYLYHWQGLMNGNEVNRRMGIYFMSDDASQTQRGNAYMAWFRVNDDNFQFYKSTDNAISGVLVQSTFDFTEGVWYDFKVTFNPQTGVMNAYIDNQLISTYTDPSPHQSGAYISLRTGNCLAQYDDIKVRKSRNTRELVTIGAPSNQDARYQSPNDTQEACRINTLINDLAGNWSTVSSENIKVDWTAPTTDIQTITDWQSADFTVDFDDADALSGVDRRFYQIRDYNGSVWASNPQRGYISESLTASLGTQWVERTGTWSITDGSLSQADEDLSNTNCYTYLQQDLSNRSMHQFDMKIEGAGSNRRAGYHFMCDAPDSSNRGNSYFVWFRVESQTIELYKVYNNTFEQVKILPFNFGSGTWHRVRNIFDRITGEWSVYVDNVLLAEWRDDTPFTTGNYISFRSGNSLLFVKNLEVFRTRYPSVQVSVGTNLSDIRFANPNPSSPSAQVRSLVVDKATNISNIDSVYAAIDWTVPSNVAVTDGLTADIDTTHVATELSANWTASVDVNSDIASYWLAIGTSALGADVADWTNVGTNLSANITGLNLIDQQIYYVSVKSQNGAGLWSDAISSDGQRFVIDTKIKALDNAVWQVYPNPSQDLFYVSGLEAGTVQYRITDVSGHVIAEKMVQTKGQLTINELANWSSGVYIIKLTQKDISKQIKLIKEKR